MSAETVFTNWTEFLEIKNWQMQDLKQLINSFKKTGLLTKIALKDYMNQNVLCVVIGLLMLVMEFFTANIVEMKMNIIFVVNVMKSFPENGFFHFHEEIECVTTA